MKKNVKVKILEHKENQEKYYCDLCGAEISSEGNREKYIYKICEYETTKLEYSEESYGEWTAHKIDVCVPCMKRKVLPLLRKTFKIKVRTEEGYSDKNG